MRVQRLERRPTLLERRPVLASVGIVAAVLFAAMTVTAVGFALLGGASLTRATAAGTLLPVAVRLTLGGLLLVVLARHGWLAIGFTGPRHWRQIWLAGVPALYVLGNLSRLLWSDLAPDPDLRLVAAAVLQGTSVGFLEETLFRGVVLAALLNRWHASRREMVRAVLIASVLFSLWHLPTSRQWAADVAQWLYTFFLAVAFCAVLLRTGSIWLLIAVHALVYASAIAANVLTLGVAAPIEDIAGAVTEREALRNAALAVLATLPMLPFGLYLLRDPTRLNLTFLRHSRR